MKPAGRYTVSTDVCKDIHTAPISNPSFSIWGFDITLKILLRLNFTKQLHSELQQSLRIINQLACDRYLKYFIIVSNAECNSCSKCTGLEFIREQLILWIIHAHVVYCPIFGYPIATFKLLIFGQFTDEHVIPEITLNETSHGLEYRIYDHIDTGYKSPHNKVVFLQQENLDHSILNHKVTAPLSLAFITDKSMCIRVRDHNTHIIPESEEVVEIEVTPDDLTSSFDNILSESKDKLFFIKYTPVGTLRTRWFLVQVEDDQSDVMGKNLTFCSFFQRHPKDDGKGDNSARWWLEWRELEWKNEDKYHYRERFLLSHRSKSDATKYGKFCTKIILQDKNITLA